jgi:hypothetical protein
MKTGGTSLTEGLRELVSPRVSLTEIFLDDFVSVPRDELDHVSLVSGHLGYEARQLMLSRFATCIALRDPVERTLSHFAHLRRNPAVLAEAPDLSLEDFLESPRWCTLARNYQARQLVQEVGLTGAGIEFSPAERFRSLGPPFPPEHELPLQSFFDCSPLSVPPDELRDRAVERLESIEFVGVTEQLDGLFAKVARALGFDDPGPLPRLQVSPERPSRAELPRRLVETIKKATAVDHELYELAGRLATA